MDNNSIDHRSSDDRSHAETPAISEDIEIADLVFSDYPMFDAVMVRRHDICRQLVEAALMDREIGDVLSVICEETVDPSIGARGVRLDAVVRATGAILDVEMQTYSSTDMGKRMRYYQAAMDVASLRRGFARTDGGKLSMPYTLLSESYVIFICLEDQLKLGLPVYTFDVTCAEDARAQLNHGYQWVVLNASAWEELPVGRLRSVLKYVATGEDDKTDSLIGDISAECAKLNEDEVWKKEGRAMMTLQHDLEAREYYYRNEGRKQGLSEGRAEGRVEAAALFAALVEAGRTDDIIRAANDKAYCNQLCQEFQL